MNDITNMPHVEYAMKITGNFENTLWYGLVPLWLIFWVSWSIWKWLNKDEEEKEKEE